MGHLLLSAVCVCVRNLKMNEKTWWAEEGGGGGGGEGKRRGEATQERKGGIGNGREGRETQ